MCKNKRPLEKHVVVKGFSVLFLENITTSLIFLLGITKESKGEKEVDFSTTNPYLK